MTGGTPTVLASFGPATDGALPFGDLTLIGSTFYGTTSIGGPGGHGTVFSFPLSGGAITDLANFNLTNGGQPEGDLTLVGSNLYGTTVAGGANNFGTIFSVPLGGGSVTTVVSFDGPNGDHPYGTLIDVGSTLYGTTITGGANNGTGTVFALVLPEPSSLVLFGLGAIGLAVAALRGRRGAWRRVASQFRPAKIAV